MRRIDLIGAADGVGDEGLEQRRRDVVHAVKVDVLEQVQGHALAGAGQAADDDQTHAGGRPRSALQDEERALMTSSAWWSEAFSLCFLTQRSSLSVSASMAAYMSASVASA